LLPNRAKICNVSLTVVIIWSGLCWCSVSFGQVRKFENLTTLELGLESEDKEVRLASLHEIEKLGAQARTIIPSIVGLFHDPDADVRAAAIQALGAMRGEARVAVKELMDLLADHDPYVKRAAADTLAIIRNEARIATPNLLELLKSNDPDVRRSGARALGSINSFGAEESPDTQATVSALIQLLRDREPSVRYDAVASLIEIGPAAGAAASHFVDLLFDNDEQVRINAANGIAALNGFGVQDEAIGNAVPLLRKLLQDPSPGMRAAVAMSLGTLRKGAISAIPEFIALLKDEDVAVRRNAILALALIGYDAREAVPELIKILRDGDTLTRLAATQALGSMGRGAKTAIPDLIFQARGSDKILRRSAAGALAGIAADLGGAGETEYVEQLKRAYVALRVSDDEEIQKSAAAVKQSIDRLQSSRWNKAYKWIESHPKTSYALLAVPLLLIVWLLLLWLRPLWLLMINEWISQHADKLPTKLIPIEAPVRYVLLVGFFHYHPRVLNAWVNAHLKLASQRFSQKPTVQERSVHIQQPMRFNNRTLTELAPGDLVATFGKTQSYLLIWGPGGSGKSSLACLIATWLSGSDSRNNFTHPMIPILLEQELEQQISNDKEGLLKVIGQQLRVLIDKEEVLPAGLLKTLLKRRRVLIILDSFSEMSESARINIVVGITELPVNACIVTSRIEESMSGLQKDKIEVLQISGNKLASFMEAYLVHREKRDLFDDEEFFEGCRRLSEIVGDSQVTALIAKYYAEQMIVFKEGVVGSELPRNVPDLMLMYLHALNRNAPKDAPDILVLQRAAQCVAWECLKQSFRPSSASRTEVLSALGGEVQGVSILTYLDRGINLVKQSEFGSSVRYSIDPLAEYLAGFHLVNTFGSSEKKWRKFLSMADEKEGAPESIKGFLLAVRDCCLTIGAEPPHNVPEFVGDELGNRAHLNAESQRLMKTERRVKRHIQKLQFVDADDRIEAAQSLEHMGEDAKRAVSHLIRALTDPSIEVRIAAARALGAIGSDLALPALNDAYSDSNEGVRINAFYAIRRIQGEGN
jgi:HEAT repeat protein